MMLIFLPLASAMVHDAETVETAELVVASLGRLSESGIYETLSLQRIVAAAKRPGVLHDTVTSLELDVASPYFESGAVERIDVLVLHQDTGIALAVKELPRMREDAIEAFQIERIERHRRQRHLEEEMEDVVPDDDDMGGSLVAALRASADAAIDAGRASPKDLFRDDRWSVMVDGLLDRAAVIQKLTDFP